MFVFVPLLKPSFDPGLILSPKPLPPAKRSSSPAAQDTPPAKRSILIIYITKQIIEMINHENFMAFGVNCNIGWIYHVSTFLDKELPYGKVLNLV
jgi:hypothetical protein